jgi:hypothetical protein
MTPVSQPSRAWRTPRPCALPAPDPRENALEGRHGAHAAGTDRLILATLERFKRAYRPPPLDSWKLGAMGRAERSVYLYLSAEVAGRTAAELAAETGAGRTTVYDGIKAGRKLIRGAAPRLGRGGFSDPDANAPKRPRPEHGGPNERPWG